MHGSLLTRQFLRQWKVKTSPVSLSQSYWANKEMPLGLLCSGIFHRKRRIRVSRDGCIGLFFSWAQAPGDSDSCSTLTEHLSEPILPFAPPFCLFSCLHLCFEAFTPPGGSCLESGLSPLQGIFSSLMSQRGSMGCSVCVPNLQPSSR